LRAHSTVGACAGHRCARNALAAAAGPTATAAATAARGESSHPDDARDEEKANRRPTTDAQHQIAPPLIITELARSLVKAKAIR